MKELRLLCAEDEQIRTCWMTAFRLLKVEDSRLQLAAPHAEQAAGCGSILTQKSYGISTKCDLSIVVVYSSYLRSQKG
jgi:hypothetical protein